jgi:hypothetical protein
MKYLLIIILGLISFRAASQAHFHRVSTKEEALAQVDTIYGIMVVSVDFKTGALKGKAGAMTLSFDDDRPQINFFTVDCYNRPGARPCEVRIFTPWDGPVEGFIPDPIEGQDGLSVRK